MKKFLTLTIIAIITLFLIATNVQATETVVEVSTAEQLIQELSNVEANETVTIKLTDNINVTGFVVSKGENITIDLNGKKIAAQTLFQVNNGTVILKGNGVIETTEDLFYVDTTTSSGNAKVEVGANVKAISGYSGIYIKGKNAEAHVYGSLTAIGPYDTIMGNGKITSVGTIINIYSGAEVISENSIGIYHPQDGELNIYGGTITGKTAVYHKAGKLNISGGTLKATGEEAEYVHNPNGCDATGDALVIEACDYAGGFPEVLITGGTFISNNNQAIGYYSQDNFKEYKLENEKFIEGGFFTSDVSEFVATKCVINPSFEYDFDTYEVKLNTPYVTNGALTEEGTDKIEIGVYSEIQEELERIFKEEINKNKTLKEALEAGKSVRIDVQVERLEEKDIKEEELKALKETAKDGKFVKFYDITLQMIANQTEDLGTISEISNKLTFKVLIPEELVKDGRTFFMYRYHDGKVEKLTGEVDEENYFVFESDRFSTYALAYEDKVEGPTAGGEGTSSQQPAEGEKDDTPTTGSLDVVLFASAIVAVISVAGIVTVKKYTR